MSKSAKYVLEGINDAYSIWNSRFKKAYQKKGYSQAGLARELAQSYPGLFPSEWAQEDGIAPSRGQTRISDWCNLGKNGNTFPSYERMLAIAETVGEPLPFLLGETDGYTLEEQYVADYLGIGVKGVQGIHAVTEIDHEEGSLYVALGGVTASEALTRLLAADNFAQKFIPDLTLLLNPNPSDKKCENNYDQQIWQWITENWKNSCLFKVSNDLTEIYRCINRDIQVEREISEKEFEKVKEEKGDQKFAEFLSEEGYEKNIKGITELLREGLDLSDAAADLLATRTMESLHSNPDMSNNQWLELIRKTVDEGKETGKLTIDAPLVKEVFHYLGILHK